LGEEARGVNFLDFAASYGLRHRILIARALGRVKTDDIPKKKNGSYKFDGRRRLRQNHATMDQVAMCKPRRNGSRAGFIDKAAMRRASRSTKRSASEARTDRGSKRKAEDMVKRAALDFHPTSRQGLPAGEGLRARRRAADPDARVLALQADEQPAAHLGRRHEVLPHGGKAKGSVFFIGPIMAQKRWLVRRLRHRPQRARSATRAAPGGAGIVCFSAANLAHVGRW
jgi:beta-glucosidase-like glycosyl hydrolase